MNQQKGFVNIVLVIVIIIIAAVGGYFVFSKKSITSIPTQQNSGTNILNEPNQSNTYTVNMNYGKPLKEIIAEGGYTSAGTPVTAEDCLVQGEGLATIKIELLHLKGNMKTSEILQVMESKGYRPANVVEILSLGEQYSNFPPDVQVVSLESDCAWSGSGPDELGKGTPQFFQITSDKRYITGSLDSEWYTPAYSYAMVKK